MQEINKIKEGFWLIKYKRSEWDKIDTWYGSREFRDRLRKRLEDKIKSDFDVEKSRKIKEELFRRIEERILRDKAEKKLNLE